MHPRSGMAASGHRPTVFLHIGLPKTATSTIQGFLQSNRNELRRRGVLYPLTGISGGAHHQFGAAYEGRKRDWVEDCSLPVLLAALRTEVAESGCTQVILSSEIFTYVKDANLLRQTLVRDYDVTVLVALRRQDRWLESCLRQDMQVGDYSGSIEQYVLHRKYQGNYLALIEFWEDLIGPAKIVPRLMAQRGERGAVQRNFFEDCGIPWSDRYSINADANPRLSRECIEFLQLSSVERRVAGFYARVRTLLSDYSAEHPDPPQHRSMLSPTTCREILSEFEAGNARLAQRYFPELTGQLFEPVDLEKDAGWEEYPGLDLPAAGRIAFYLIERLGQPIGP